MLRISAATAVALLAALPAAASAAPLTISPAAGTPDVSPETQISVLGVAPDRIAAVRLTGAQSGRHAGRLRPYSGGRGASFVPRRPLTEGERATLVVRVRGRRPVRRGFTVARLGPPQPALTLTARQPDKLHAFVSRPDLAAPRITVLRPAPHLPGSILLTPLPSPVVHPGSVNTISISPVGPGGPMIVDGRGRVVWFRQLEPPEVAANLRVQRLGGRRVLTWWQGTVTPSAFGHGVGIVADRSYRTLRTIRAGNGYEMDLHELELTPGGDALFTVYSPILVHLPGTPAGKLSPLLDAIVQQVDVRTGLVVWEWHAYGHIPLADSYATPANSASYDAFHFNALQDIGGDRVLVSARDTSAVYAVDRASGRIAWTLGGRASTFRLGPGARFWFQHDARMLPGGRVSLFDDEAGPPQKAPSARGLVLRLDHRRRRATVVSEYRRPRDTSPQSEGSVQALLGGGAFVGFGSEPFFSQFSARGRMVFDARLPLDDGSYRAYRVPWRGAPRTRPAVVARDGAVWVSWNGATEVARWQVLDGGSRTVLATARRRGFETRIALPAGARAVVVRALDGRGHVLGSSRRAAVA